MSSLSFTVLSKPLKAHVVLWSLVGCLWSGHALADDYADVNRLIKAGQNAEALNKVDQYLVNKPRDPQMRFLKGVILAETGKSTEAIATFVKLTEEFPELPEPYNNLAVLYASQSQFDKARVALEMAIRTNPSYATAHENLGDVYAKLASQAYSKALQLDSTNAGVPPKLALIRNLFAPEAKGVRPAAAAAAPAPAAAAPAPAPVAPTPAAQPAPVKATDAAAASKPTPVQPAVASVESEDVIGAVKAWAKAWSAKDMDGYLSAYGSKFDPAGSRSRKDWEQERKARIVSKGSISVEVSDFDVKVADAKATAVFRQHYKAGSLVSNSRKTLEMAKENGRWVIVRESTGG
jgi:Flp pilus assembly protein TadD